MPTHAEKPAPNSGPVVLLGSGETSPSGGRIFEAVARQINGSLRIAILETPAGFEPNSAQVAGRVAEFLQTRLQNYKPAISVIPARRRDGDFSPDNPALLQPLLDANLIFMGPGSPTYAVRHLKGSRAWHTLAARHRLGAAITLASAATLAIGAQTLPIYEIYKVGEDLHWREGLDFFAPYGLSLTFIPHWDNTEGGADLDTSRCFMGKERFAQLQALLPPDTTVVGIDEHTALRIDFEVARCEVMGRGGVTLIASGREQHYAQGQTFSLAALGDFRQPEAASGIPPAVWEAALAAQAEARAPEPPAEVLELVQARQAARKQKDWAQADDLRQRIAAHGWNVLDTPEGPQLEPAPR
jgi:cyanophycinase-like exopeptidase